MTELRPRSRRAMARALYVAEATLPDEAHAAPAAGAACAPDAADAGEPAGDTPSAMAQRLYEAGVVPVREIARLLGVSERTLYKHVARGGWRRRYAVRGAQARGAGGRFVRSEDADKPHASGLKALDPKGATRALVAGRRAEALAGKAAAQADALHEMEWTAVALHHLAEIDRLRGIWRAAHSPPRPDPTPLPVPLLAPLPAPSPPSAPPLSGPTPSAPPVNAPQPAPGTVARPSRVPTPSLLPPPEELAPQTPEEIERDRRVNEAAARFWRERASAHPRNGPRIRSLAAVPSWLPRSRGD